MSNVSHSIVVYTNFHVISMTPDDDPSWLYGWIPKTFFKNLQRNHCKHTHTFDSPTHCTFYIDLLLINECLHFVLHCEWTNSLNGRKYMEFWYIQTLNFKVSSNKMLTFFNFMSIKPRNCFVTFANEYLNAWIFECSNARFSLSNRQYERGI